MFGKYACRVIRAYSFYRVGAIIYPTGTLRDYLKARGFIEVLDNKPPEEETYTREQPKRKPRKKKK